MEKLAVEIDLTTEEMGDLNRLIELECLDQKKWIRRVITEVVQRRLEGRRRSKSGVPANQLKEG